MKYKLSVLRDIKRCHHYKTTTLTDSKFVIYVKSKRNHKGYFFGECFESPSASILSESLCSFLEGNVIDKRDAIKQHITSIYCQATRQNRTSERDIITLH